MLVKCVVAKVVIFDCPCILMCTSMHCLIVMDWEG